MSASLCRKLEGEERAAIRLSVGGCKCAAVFCNDAMRERESDAVSLRLGGVKGNEDAPHIFFADTASAILDLNHDPLIFRARCALTFRVP